MVRTNRFISVPRLRMLMIRRFGRRMSVRTIRRRPLVTGYWSRHPARCPRLTLEHRRRRREWGRRHRVCDLKQWRHCIFATANTAANCQVIGRWQFSARSSQDTGGVSKMHKQNFATQPSDWPTTSEEAWRFDENLHATGRPSTAPNGQNEPLHLGSSSANADDTLIWEVDVSSNHSERASGRRILVSASSQMS